MKQFLIFKNRVIEITLSSDLYGRLNSAVKMQEPLYRPSKSAMFILYVV
jgi:hypothetical protein